jgi:hypothetical protein
MHGNHLLILSNDIVNILNPHWFNQVFRNLTITTANLASKTYWYVLSECNLVIILHVIQIDEAPDAEQSSILTWSFEKSS